MDDPLRPKAVPLSAETVLWFEFLLDPQLITNHLKKSSRPDPSPTELLMQFISMTPDIVTRTYEIVSADGEPMPTTTSIPVTPGCGAPLIALAKAKAISSDDIVFVTCLPRKQLALKILALKVATWLRWDLDIIERELPIAKQLYLLRDLCTVSFGRLVPMPLAMDFDPIITPDGHEKAARFALTLYHRWVIRLQILKDIALKSSRPNVSSIFIPLEPMHQYCAPDINPQGSLEYLQDLLDFTEPFYIFTYDTFVPLHPDDENIQQNYDSMEAITLAELRAQIYYDLVTFYLYTKQYTLAREAATQCRRNLLEAKREQELKMLPSGSALSFCLIDEQELEGYLMACGVSSNKVSLMERFNLAQLSQYKDIVEILQLDNQAREISLVNRRIVELDIEAATSQGVIKDGRKLEMNVAALNLVRSILENDDIFPNADYFEKYSSFEAMTTFLQHVSAILPHCSVAEQNSFKDFITECFIRFPGNKTLTVQVEALNLFTSTEFQELQSEIQQEDDMLTAVASAVPVSLVVLQEKPQSQHYSQQKKGTLERHLIACTSANTVRKLLVRLAAANPPMPLWAINPSWEIAMPIKSVLMAMQRGFLQDFGYVLLGKARELTAKSDFIGAVSMLSVLRSETQRQELVNTSLISKLGKLVNWEILYVQIIQCLEDWHRKPLDLQSLGSRSKQCLACLQTGDTVLPRIEILDACAMMLLNLNDCAAMMPLDKRLSQLEIPIAFAATILDMEKMKNPKQIRRDSWDLVLAMFQNKRNTTGGGNSRSSPCLAVSTGLQPFLKRIRNQTLFSLVISLLGKIHNILKDDPNHDLNGEYVQLWPTTISNPLSYNIRSVSETLHWLLTEALKYYPQNIAWLKMKGDLELAIGNNEAAMRCYVNALITGTEYCTIPLQRNVADDYVIRKMIRCCTNLGCYTQATVLCQFLDEIDYSIVIKNLQEKTLNYTDAMDAYYSCIWDTTLLEFIINFHSRKGEHARKLEAITVMGSLELNANNNEEIKREAAAVRKARFLRALAKQYLL